MSKETNERKDLGGEIVDNAVPDLPQLLNLLANTEREREREREKERQRQTDRQTDRQTERQIHRHTDIHMSTRGTMVMYVDS
jgi:hypothetical protein